MTVTILKPGKGVGPGGFDPLTISQRPFGLRPVVACVECGCDDVTARCGHFDCAEHRAAARA